MELPCRVYSKGQVVLPKKIRALKGFATGSELRAIDVKDGILLKRQSFVADELRALSTRFGKTEEIDWTKWYEDYGQKRFGVHGK